MFYEQIASQYVAIRDQETGNYVYQFVHPGASGRADYRCIITFVGQMGALKAGLITQKLLHDWKPMTLVLLGVAAALDNDVRPSDIVDPFVKSKKVPLERYPFSISMAN